MKTLARRAVHALQGAQLACRFRRVHLHRAQLRGGGRRGLGRHIGLHATRAQDRACEKAQDCEPEKSSHAVDILFTNTRLVFGGTRTVPGADESRIAKAISAWRGAVLDMPTVHAVNG